MFFRFLKIIGVMLAGGMFAAMGDWRDGDILIIAQKGRERTAQACFKGKEVMVEGASESGASSNLYDVASEQLLAGYSFLPGIEKSRPSLYKSGVRQFICEKQPFSSKNLQKCLECIERALQKRQTVYVRKPIFWRNLTADMAKEYFYSEGKQWQWSVVEKGDMMPAGDSLQIMFRGETDVLEGVLRDQDKTVLDKKPSLLDLKQAPPPRPVRMQGLRLLDRDIPETPADFFNTERYPYVLNCGILYFPGDGSQKGLLFQGDHLRLKMSIYGWYEDSLRRDTVTDVLRMIFLKGYCLKHESCAKKNLQVLTMPSVREVACERVQAFLASEAEGVLKSLGEYRKNDIHRSTDNAWDGLHYEELSSVFSTPRNPVWSLLDEKGLQDMTQQKYAYPRIVVFLDGENVALCGTLDQEPPVLEERVTLFDLACKAEQQQATQ